MPDDYDDYAFEHTAKRFKKKGVNPTDENDLIRVIENASDLYDVYDAAILLRRFGSAQAIPALKRAMYYAMQDLQIASLCTLAGIAKETEADFYTTALLDTKYRTKWAAMYAISEYGNASAIAPVIKRLKAILSRPRGRTWGNNTEVVLAVNFLNKFAEADHLSSEALSFVESKWSILLPPEQAKLASIPYFHRHQAELVTAQHGAAPDATATIASAWS